MTSLLKRIGLTVLLIVLLSLFFDIAGLLLIARGLLEETSLGTYEAITLLLSILLAVLANFLAVHEQGGGIFLIILGAGFVILPLADLFWDENSLGWVFSFGELQKHALMGQLAPMFVLFIAGLVALILGVTWLIGGAGRPSRPVWGGHNE